MIEMGFLDIDANKEALQETKGNVYEAIYYLEKRNKQSERIISNDSSSSTSSNVGNFEHEYIGEVDGQQNLESPLSIMIEMGFLDIDANKEALQETKGNVYEAIDYLEKRNKQSERIISNDSSSSTFSNTVNSGDNYLTESYGSLGEVCTTALSSPLPPR